MCVCVCEVPVWGGEFLYEEEKFEMGGKGTIYAEYRLCCECPYSFCYPCKAGPKIMFEIYNSFIVFGFDVPLFYMKNDFVPYQVA